MSGVSDNNKFIFEGLNENVYLDLGDARDCVFVDNVTGSVTINSGDSQGQIIINEVTGEVTIDDGVGNDRIYGYL